MTARTHVDATAIETGWTIEAQHDNRSYVDRVYYSNGVVGITVWYRKDTGEILDTSCGAGLGRGDIAHEMARTPRRDDEVTRRIADELDTRDEHVAAVAAMATATGWVDEISPAPVVDGLCRVAGCAEVATHHETAHPDAVDSRRCAEHATREHTADDPIDRDAVGWSFRLGGRGDVYSVHGSLDAMTEHAARLLTVRDVRALDDGRLIDSGCGMTVGRYMAGTDTDTYLALLNH